jgi:hypothetical protein
LWKFHSARATLPLGAALTKFDLDMPAPYPEAAIRDGRTIHLLDRSKQEIYSNFLHRSKMTLPDFVRLLRGETLEDPRPNKALEVPNHMPCWESFQYRREWEGIVREGVRPRWIDPFVHNRARPANHGSALRALNSIVKNIRKGQDAGQYLVLDIDLLDQLDGITCSPFGAVPKGGADLSVDARVIHDLSFPHGTSVNDNTAITASVTITYDGALAIAERITHCATNPTVCTKMSTGDVNGAFRHVPINADHVGRFSGTLIELGVVIIDLACPFGWTESPACYWVAGSAINHIYSHTAPSWPIQPLSAADSFDGKVWCDDHVCVEQDVGTRLAESNVALRRAMTAVLGPTACNENKFSTWFTEGKALGLTWNTVKCTVSMPADKIAKARTRASSLLTTSHTTRSKLMKLLGSLRHVATCVRPAAPFFQRVVSLLRATPRFGRHLISPGSREDIRWFLAILDRVQLHSIPLERFSATQEPSIHIHMDASDIGLCALWPARKEYLQVRFDPVEQQLIQSHKTGDDSELGINTRELMSAVFASIVWAPRWSSHTRQTQRHVRFWIDNVTAVSWNNRRSSRNPFGQLLLRLLALQEVKHNFYSTAVHISGVDNMMADAGSRVWQAPGLAMRFADLSRSWSQVAVPEECRNLSRLWERCCSGQL